MKRHLLLTMALLLLMGMGVQAQSFEFQYKGKSLADGDMVTIAAAEDFIGQLSCETNNVDNPSNGLVLKLLLGSNASVQAKLQITHNTLDAEILQWCMGGSCTAFNENTMLLKKFNVEGSEQVQFDAINIRSNGYLTATLTASIGLETHKVNIEFTNGEYSGIRAVATPHSLTGVYTLSGIRVKEPLSAGVYIIDTASGVRKSIIKNKYQQ